MYVCSYVEQQSKYLGEELECVYGLPRGGELGHKRRSREMEIPGNEESFSWSSEGRLLHRRGLKEDRREAKR